eukprot:UN24721
MMFTNDPCITSFWENTCPRKIAIPSEMGLSEESRRLLSATSGSLMEMKKTRDMKEELPDYETYKTNFKAEPKCEYWAAVTTIFEVSPAMEKIDSWYPKWCMVIVLDKKSPAKSEYEAKLKHAHVLDVADQDKLPFHSTKTSPFNSFARKNVAFLYAIAQKPKWILDFDDDNIPLLNFDNEKEFDWLSTDTAKKVHSPNVEAPESNVVNPYLFFNPVNRDKFGLVFSWPRGFPLEHIHDSSDYSTTPIKYKNERCRCYSIVS